MLAGKSVVTTLMGNNCTNWQGLGAKNFRLGILIDKRPAFAGYQNLVGIQSLTKGELEAVVTATGNHWRKIFNISAKIGYGLWPGEYQNWQQYRDERLLQADSELAILFSPPQPVADDQWLVVTGKQYRMDLFPGTPFIPVPGGFSQHPALPVVQTPYFDYRQLPNVQLEALLQWLYPRLVSSSLSGP